MKKIRLACIAALLATSTWLPAQSQLNAGDSFLWRFKFQFDSLEQTDPASTLLGSFVMLNYRAVAGADPLIYRVDFFENDNSLTPVLSQEVLHQDYYDPFGMPLTIIHGYLPPADSWADLDGFLQLTVLSGELTDLSFSAILTVPTPDGGVAVYRAVVVPEPGTWGIVILGALCFSIFRRRRQPQPEPSVSCS